MGKLSDTQLRNWVKSGQPVKGESDGGGLYFTLSKKGTAAWIFRYRHGGKQKEYTIGRYPDISLAKARDIAVDLRNQVNNGTDIALEKQLAKKKQKSIESLDDFVDAYQILTKRSARMRKYFSSRGRVVPDNVWLGVSVENRQYGLQRVDDLREIKAGIRFLSVEPLLEDVGEMDLSGIHWVIVGGESGPKARPMKAEWVETIQEQCERDGVAFFFKQWGGWGADGKKRPKRNNGRLFAGRTWDEMPNMDCR
jgi:protein gp37